MKYPFNKVILNKKIKEKIVVNAVEMKALHLVKIFSQSFVTPQLNSPIPIRSAWISAAA